MRRIRSGCCARAAIGQRRRAAQQRDELAPFHYPMSPVLPAERIAYLSYGRSLLRCGISVRPMSQMGRIERLTDEQMCPFLRQDRTS